MSDENDQFLDELAKELQANPPSQPQSQQIVVQPPQQINGTDALEEYINTNTQKSNDILNQVILKFAADIGDDPERAIAFANLIKSNTDLLKILNDRLIKDKDNQTKIEIQKIKEQGEVLNEAIQQGAAVQLARNEMFKEIFKETEPIEVDSEDD